jgi:hypothetical protein
VKIDSEEWKLAFEVLQHLPTKDLPNFQDVLIEK